METNPGTCVARHPTLPSPRGTVQSSVRTVRPKDKPSRMRDNRDTTPDGGGPSTSAPVVRREPRASGRFCRAGCRSHCPTPHTSDRPRYTARNGRNPETVADPTASDRAIRSTRADWSEWVSIPSWYSGAHLSKRRDTGDWSSRKNKTLRIEDSVRIELLLDALHQLERTTGFAPLHSTRVVAHRRRRQKHQTSTAGQGRRLPLLQNPR
jgi:hypothetical protein